ncbi:hypothetical protein AVEN_177736-1 [Araneus ventricosus]|uniref:Integrase catalytic domain-containing protein n=1 Tax=Araneus ventricosus TaxID=182803 RepID=A0A4Y2I7T0_ARAVE|nr:hypothetical protein AVEN_177736-1 [Araneus ventricosus]
MYQVNVSGTNEYQYQDVSNTAKTCINPSLISTDRGAQFTSDVFHSLAKPFGIRLSHTAAYHPQANGAIERWHRTLKAAIMCHTSVHWVSALPAVLLGLRTVFKEDL